MYRLIRNDDNQTAIGEAPTLQAAQAQLPDAARTGGGAWARISPTLWAFESADGTERSYFVEAVGPNRDWHLAESLAAPEPLPAESLAIAAPEAPFAAAPAAFRAVSFAALATEVNTDPNGYGLVAMKAAGNDEGIAQALNLVRDGTNGGPAISVFRHDVTPAEFYNAIRQADAAALTQGARDWVSWFTTQRAIDFSQVNTRTDLQAVFPAGGAGTRASLVALAQRNGSRAEALFGPGTRLSAQDVATAFGRG